MTVDEALYQFYSGFGLRAMEENSVPTGNDRPLFPYLTYQVATGDFDTTVALSASLWYRSESLVEINAKRNEISRAIGPGGVSLKVDNGRIWITRGTPFSSTMGDPEDALIKRMILNVSVSYLTTD